MIFLLSCCLVIIVAYFTLPAEVWAAIFSNCLDSKGLPRPRYVTREVRGVISFYADLLLLATLLSIPVTALFVTVADRVPAMLADAPNAVQLTASGASQSEVESLRLVWRLGPLIAAGSFAVVATGCSFLSVGFERAVADFANRELEREYRRTVRRYLRDNPPRPDSVIV